MELRWCGGLLWIWFLSVQAADEVGTTESPEEEEEKEASTRWEIVLCSLIAVILFVVGFALYRSRCCGAYPKPRPLSELESERRKAELKKRGLPPTSPSQSSVYCLPTRLKHPYPPPSYSSPASLSNLSSVDTEITSLPADVVLRIHPDDGGHPHGVTSPPPSYTSEGPREEEPGRRTGPYSPPPSYQGDSSPTSSSSPSSSASSTDSTDSPPSPPSPTQQSPPPKKSSQTSAHFVSIDL